MFIMQLIVVADMTSTPPPVSSLRGYTVPPQHSRNIVHSSALRDIFRGLRSARGQKEGVNHVVFKQRALISKLCFFLVQTL